MKNNKTFRRIFISLLFPTFFLSFSFAQKGENLFKTTCAACHTIGKGLLVGPDLKNTNEKYPEEWLLKWIKSSQTMVKEGDETAVALFEKYNKVPMPDNPSFTDEDIKEILAYIKTKSEEQPQASAAPATATDNAPQSSVTQINISSGIYILFGAILVFLLIVIIVLARTVNALSRELEQGYRYDSYNRF